VSLVVTTRRSEAGPVVVWADEEHDPSGGYLIDAHDHYGDGTAPIHRLIATGYMGTFLTDDAIPAGVWSTTYQVTNLSTAATDDAVYPPSSARLYRAALLRAARWWLITKAPLGVLEGDLGSVYVSRIDTELPDLIADLRGVPIELSQEWPTANDVATEVLNLGAGSIPPEKHAALQSATTAAIEYVTQAVEKAYGLA